MRNQRSQFIPAALMLCLVASATSGAAQVKTQRSAPTEPTVSVDFPGGSLHDFSAVLRRAGAEQNTGPAVNIVLPDSSKRVLVPPIKLQLAGVGSALRAVGEIISDFKVRVTPIDGPGALVFAVSIREERSRRSSGGVTHVTPTSTTPAPKAKAVKLVSVFSLRELTVDMPGSAAVPGSTMPVETILTAVETGLGIVGDGAKLHYHADSGLLFVHGSRVAVATARDVLTNLEVSIDKTRSAARRSGSSRRSTKSATPKKSSVERR